jgi:hypothetical protein
MLWQYSTKLLYNLNLLKLSGDFYQCNCLEILVGFSTLRQVMRMIVTKMIPASRAEAQLSMIFISVILWQFYWASLP